MATELFKSLSKYFHAIENYTYEKISKLTIPFFSSFPFGIYFKVMSCAPKSLIKSYSIRF